MTQGRCADNGTASAYGLDPHERLNPLVLEHRLPSAVRYGICACIIAACAMLQMALHMQTGVPGYFLRLPGVVSLGLIFADREYSRRSLRSASA